MNPVDQSSRRRFRPIGGRGSLLLLSVALTGLAGCADGLGSRRQGDPLVGIHTQPVPVAQSGAGNGLVPAVGGPVPALPASYTAPGSVAIAGGETTTPVDPRHLEIPDAVPAAQPSAGTVRGAPPGVIVGDPVPVTNDSTSRRPPASPSTLQQIGAASPTGAAAITTFEEAQQFLTKHGVTWQRFDVEDGQWKFECSIPNPSNRKFDRHLKTDRAFPDYLSAMRAIIAAIEKMSN
jgi:hypothetical protein